MHRRLPLFVACAFGLVACGSKVTVFETVDAAIPRDAALDGALRDASPDAAPDAGVPDSGVPDGGTPDAGDPDDRPGCRIEAFDGVGEPLGALVESFYAPDGRLRRVTLESIGFEETSPDAIVTALAWDEAGRVTRAQYTDLRFAVPIAFRTEDRTYDATGRLIERVVTEEDGTVDRRRWVYEDGLLRRIEGYNAEMEVWFTWSELTLDAPLAGTSGRVDLEAMGQGFSLEWNADGRVVQETETLRGGGRETCRATDLVYDAGGNLVEEREHLCGEPAVETTREHRVSAAEDTVQLDIIDITGRGAVISTRRVWATGVDRVDVYRSLHTGMDGSTVADFQEFNRYTDCGATPELNVSLFSSQRSEIVESLYAGAPIDAPHGGSTRLPELVPTLRP